MKDRTSGRAGFTLIELIIAIAIVAILSTIGTFAFHAWTVKTNVSAEAQQIATDLRELRLRAMTTKLPHVITVNPKSYVFQFYSTDNDPGTLVPGGNHYVAYPLSRKNGAAAVPCAGETYQIDQMGLLVGSSATIFVNFGGASNLDCVNIRPIIVSTGKTDTTGVICNDQ